MSLMRNSNSVRKQIRIFCVILSLFFCFASVPAQGPELVLQTGHIAGVGNTVFSPDGKYIAAAGFDGKIKIWDIYSGRELREFSAFYFNDLAFTPVGSIITCGFESVKDEVIGLDRAEYFLKEWDLRTGKLIRTIVSGADRIGAVAASRDGRIIASARSENASVSANGNVVISATPHIIDLWDAKTGSKLTSLRGRSTFISVSFSQDSKQVAASSGDHITNQWKIQIWNAMSMKPVRSIDIGEDGGNRLFFSADGKGVACSDRQYIRTYEIETGKEKSATVRPGDVAFSNDERLFSVVAIDKSQTIQVFDLGKRSQVANLEGHASYLERLSISHDGRLLAMAANGVIRIWDLTSVNSPFVSASGQYNIRTLAFSPDGIRIASGADSGRLKVFDTTSGKQLWEGGHNAWVNSVAFSADGRLLASASSDRSIKIWDVLSGQQIKQLNGHTDNVETVAFSHDNKTLVSGGQDKTVRLWDLDRGEEIARLDKFAFGSGSTTDLFPVTNVAFAPNDATVIVEAQSTRLMIWDKRSASVQYPEEYTRQQIFEMFREFPDLGLLKGVSPARQIQFRRGDNGTLVVSELGSEREIARIATLGTSDWMVFTPDGSFDGTANAWRQAVWRFNNNTFDYGAVELYFNDYFYPNLLQDVLAGKVLKPKPGNELEKKDRRQPAVKITAIDGKSREELAGRAAGSGMETIVGRTVPVEIEVTESAGEKKQKERAASSGAGDLRLFRNGTLVRVWHDSVFDKASGCEQLPVTANEPRKARCTVNVTLTAGDNELNAYAFNTSNVKSTDDTLSVKAADMIRRSGTLHVLAIGVNEYADTGYDLKYAVADVDEISKAIMHQQEKLTGDGKSRTYDRTEIVMLTDSDATRENILLALQLFANGKSAPIPATLSNLAKTELAKIKPTGPEDALIIYYAGHGTSRDERFYLMPHDYNGKVDETGVSDIDLNKYLERVDVGKMLMVIDACQSGAALGRKDEGRAPMNSKGLAQLAYDKGMLILTAAQSQQAALEALTIGGKNIEHGLLTYALLEALNDQKADRDGNGQLWEREWLDYAVEQVPKMQAAAINARSDKIDLDDGDKSDDPSKRKMQTPRVFYRREADPRPLVIAHQ